MEEIKLPSGEYIFVEIPNDAENVRCHTHFNQATYLIKFESFEIKLPKGKWVKISTTKDITEEQAKSIIPSKQTLSGVIYPHYPLLNDPSGYYNEEHWASICLTAKDALDSLLNANELNESNYLILKKL